MMDWKILAVIGAVLIAFEAIECAEDPDNHVRINVTATPYTEAEAMADIERMEERLEQIRERDGDG